MRGGLKVAVLGVAVAALAATATYWRSRCLRLEKELLASRQEVAAGEPTRPAPAVAQASNLPLRAPGRLGHSRKPPWKKALAEKLRREEGIERATEEDLRQAWGALMRKALDDEIERRLADRRVGEADRRRLLDELERVRDVNEVEVSGGENADVRARMLRTVALLQADRVFRDVLGVGLSDFVTGLSGSSQVQEVSTEKASPGH